MLRSAIPFWWCAPTPLKLRRWLREAQAVRKVLDAKTPLSVWYCLMLMLLSAVSCSRASLLVIVLLAVVENCGQWKMKPLAWLTKMVPHV